MFDVPSGTTTKNVNVMYLDATGGSHFLSLPQSSDALQSLVIAYDTIYNLGTQHSAIEIAYRPLNGISIHHNYIDSAKNGILVMGDSSTSANSNIDVYHNNVRNLGSVPGQKFGFGIYVGHFDDIDINHNQIRNTCEDGIRVGMSTNARIRYNNVGYEWKDNCDLQGIKAADSRYIYIEYNEIYDVPGREQIAALGSSDVWIRYNLLNSQESQQLGVKVHNSGTSNSENVYIKYNDTYVSDPVKVFTGPYGNGTVHFTYVERNNFYDFCRGVMANMPAKVDDSFGPVRHLYVRENLIRSKRGGCSDRSVELYYVGYSKVQNNCLYTDPVADRIWDTELSPNYVQDLSPTYCGH